MISIGYHNPRTHHQSTRFLDTDHLTISMAPSTMTNIPVMVWLLSFDGRKIMCTYIYIYSSRHPKLVLSIHSAGRNSYMIGLFWRKTKCTYANILCANIGTDINPFHEINGNPTHHILVVTRRSKLRSIQSQGCYLRKNRLDHPKKCGWWSINLNKPWLLRGVGWIPWDGWSNHVKPQSFPIFWMVIFFEG